MKKIFPGYYRPTADEFSELWQSAVFVFDANVLLNIYGYSKPTRNALIELLRSIKSRLWIPHQFAAEYQRNRAKAILDQVANYRTIRTQLKAVLDEHFKAKHKHPFVSKRALSAFEQICDELDKGQKDHEALLSVDPYFENLTDILDTRIGEQFSEAEFTTCCDEARKRYTRRTPPGYLDAQKPEPEAFGDFIGWRQILKHGAKEQSALVLVTNDQKEDWWYIQNDRRIGPRPELIAEYLASCGKSFYMYTLEQFMVRAKQHLGQQVGSATLQEIQQRSEAQLAAVNEKSAGSAGNEGTKPVIPTSVTKPEIEKSESAASSAKLIKPNGT